MPGIKKVAWVVLGLSLWIPQAAGRSGDGEKASFEDIGRRMLTKGLVEQGAFSLLTKITGVGPRLAGSAQAAAAVDLALNFLKGMGLDNVHLEPVEVEHWIRGDEEVKLVSAVAGSIPLAACALGGSIGTPPEGILAGVLEVRSFDELHAAGAKAKGKIIFFNLAWDQSLPDTFAGYGPMARQRDRGAIEAAQAGAVAALVRSASTSRDDYPHTGLMHYGAAVAKVPAAAVSIVAADRLSETLKLDPSVKVLLRLDCRIEAPVVSDNVIGDIRGTKKPGEIILLGGHLDSWDLGRGAHDDAAGCSQAVEALRLIKDLGLEPKRTIRAVLFMDEEFGGAGGQAYARSESRKNEKHLAAIESDRGGFLPIGMGIGDRASFSKFEKWEEALRSVGLFWIRPGGGGVDIRPLAASGTVLGGLVPDSQRYFDLHHSARDVPSEVNPRELELGAVALALFAYILAQEGV
jgi:carboxypeptidase Q